MERETSQDTATSTSARHSEWGLCTPTPRALFSINSIAAINGVRVSEGGTPNGRLLLTSVLYNTLIEALKADMFHHEFPTIKLIVRLWKTVKKLMRYEGLTDYTLIWNNCNLQEILKIGKVRVWENLGIKRLRQLYSGNTLKKFPELVREFKIPQSSLFSYRQLEHALKAQFKDQPLRWKEMPLFQSVLQVVPTRGLISKI